MTTYQKLLSLGCLTREELLLMANNPKTADSIIYTHKLNGNIKSVKRNLYVAISKETHSPIATPFEIASKITNDSFISHHSAFEYYGLANQVFSDIYVSTSRRFYDFEFDGKTFKYVNSKNDFGITTIKNKLRVTDIERTILDSIKDFTKIGGLEELLRCLLMITFFDETKMLNYLSIYDNQFLYQKTGYILSHYKVQMKISDSFMENCKSRIHKSVRYFYDEIKFENPVFNSDWQLFVPADLMKLIDEGGNEIV